jgi:hypothetical protein
MVVVTPETHKDHEFALSTRGESGQLAETLKEQAKAAAIDAASATPPIVRRLALPPTAEDP